MNSSEALSDAEGAIVSRLLRLVASLCFGVVAVALCAGGSLAHGGPPLRIGVTPDPVVSAVARLALVHLREGVGFAVDWREFPDEAALRAAFAGGKLDIAVALAEPAPPAQPQPAADCPRETLAALGEGLGRRWGGEAFLLGFSVGPSVCARPALIVSRAVLEDLRFGILRKESGRMAALITREDVAAVRAAAGSGGERTATAAARAALATKPKP